jgi:hypothetical protein
MNKIERHAILKFNDTLKLASGQVLSVGQRDTVSRLFDVLMKTERSDEAVVKWARGFGFEADSASTTEKWETGKDMPERLNIKTFEALVSKRVLVRCDGESTLTRERFYKLSVKAVQAEEARRYYIEREQNVERYVRKNQESRRCETCSAEDGDACDTQKHEFVADCLRDAEQDELFTQNDANFLHIKKTLRDAIVDNFASASYTESELDAVARRLEEVFVAMKGEQS